jgi:hypothetical protein
MRFRGFRTEQRLSFPLQKLLAFKWSDWPALELDGEQTRNALRLAIAAEKGSLSGERVKR